MVPGEISQFCSVRAEAGGGIEIIAFHQNLAVIAAVQAHAHDRVDRFSFASVIFTDTYQSIPFSIRNKIGITVSSPGVRTRVTPPACWR